MRLMILIVFFPLFIFCGSCKKLGLCKDEELSIERKNYTGNELKFDGFYYDEGGEPDWEGKTLHSIIVLYRNSIALKPGSAEKNELENYIDHITKHQDAYKDIKDDWAVFIVDKFQIAIEGWRTSRGCYPTELWEGEILNDSTFVIKKEIIKKGKRIDTFEVNTTYHFREYSPKPDSTQDFIK